MPLAMTTPSIPIISNYLDHIDDEIGKLRNNCALFDREPNELRKLDPQELETYQQGREQIAKIIERGLWIQTEFNRVVRDQPK